MSELRQWNKAAFAGEENSWHTIYNGYVQIFTKFPALGYEL
jgi:hypothetical protein